MITADTRDRGAKDKPAQGWIEVYGCSAGSVTAYDSKLTDEFYEKILEESKSGSQSIDLTNIFTYLEVSSGAPELVSMISKPLIINWN